jgi:hypothetical protein
MIIVQTKDDIGLNQNSIRELEEWLKWQSNCLARVKQWVQPVNHEKNK